jgi:hypothetical protein
VLAARRLARVQVEMGTAAHAALDSSSSSSSDDEIEGETGTVQLTPSPRQTPPPPHADLGDEVALLDMLNEPPHTQETHPTPGRYRVVSALLLEKEVRPGSDPLGSLPAGSVVKVAEVVIPTAVDGLDGGGGGADVVTRGSARLRIGNGWAGELAHDGATLLHPLGSHAAIVVTSTDAGMLSKNVEPSSQKPTATPQTACVGARSYSSTPHDEGRQHRTSLRELECPRSLFDAGPRHALGLEDSGQEATRTGGEASGSPRRGATAEEDTGAEHMLNEMELQQSSSPAVRVPHRPQSAVALTTEGVARHGHADEEAAPSRSSCRAWLYWLQRKVRNCTLLVGAMAFVAVCTAASADGPYALSLLLSSALVVAIALTFYALPPIKGFTMRMVALTTCLGFTICTAVAVLLPVDVAVLARAGGHGRLYGFDGIDEDVLYVIWSPLYWLSSVMGYIFTFVVYYQQSGFLTHNARVRATCAKFALMKGLLLILGVSIVVTLAILGTLPAFNDTDSWRLLTELLKVILVSTYMTLETVSLGFGLVKVPTRLFVPSAASYRRFLEYRFGSIQKAWNQATEVYYSKWEKAEAARLQVRPH